MKRLFTALLPIVVIPALSSCTSNPAQPACVLGSPTTVPATDASPPTAALDIFLADGRVVSIAGGSTPLSVTQPSGRVTLIAKATDANGPKDIQIRVETITCTIAGGAATCGSPVLSIASNANTTAVGSPTCTERIAQINLDVIDTSTRRVSHSVSVVAVNYGGQRAEIKNISLSAK